MKKIFTNPEIEITKLNGVDVVCTSDQYGTLDDADIVDLGE